MKLWLITQDENRGYDTYDSAVVVADSYDEAIRISPDGGMFGREYGTWASSPYNVKATYLGEADEGFSPGTIILGSYNAG